MASLQEHAVVLLCACSSHEAERRCYGLTCAVLVIDRGRELGHVMSWAIGKGGSRHCSAAVGCREGGQLGLMGKEAGWA